MRKHNGMRPQDVLILLKLSLVDQGEWRYASLASEINVSQSEVAEALNRCRQARLVDGAKRKVLRQSLLEFLVHGLKYVFPAQPGALVRGMPTAHAAPPLAEKVISEEPFVWADPEGEQRGQAIEPLYPSVLKASKQDPQLYELLALCDALRVGRVRETDLAAEALKSKLIPRIHV